MKLHSESFPDQGVIAERNAFARIDPKAHVALAGNRNPHLAWSDVPAGTRSFVILAIDLDAPTRPDDVNQEGREVPAELPRAEFFHWVLVDVAADVRAIAEGGYSSGVTPRGKAGPLALDGTRQGLNDYTGWFAGDAAMAGQYFGYDGPYPPPHDLRTHRYFFRIFALDVAALSLPTAFTAADVLRAMRGHVLDEAAIYATYSLNS